MFCGCPDGNACARSRHLGRLERVVGREIDLQFEDAARLRDQIQKLEKTELEIKKDPFVR